MYRGVYPSDLSHSNLTPSLTSYNIFEGFAALIDILPDIGQLGERAENATLQLVKIVAEVVWVLSESWLFGVDCKLDLSDEAIIEFYVDKDVIGLGA